MVRTAWSIELVSISNLLKHCFVLESNLSWLLNLDLQPSQAQTVPDSVNASSSDIREFKKRTSYCTNPTGKWQSGSDIGDNFMFVTLWQVEDIGGKIIMLVIFSVILVM